MATLVAMLCCVSVTPLGKPVVPDEYSSAAGSSPRRSSGVKAPACAGTAASQSASVSVPAGAAPGVPSQTTTWRTAGQRSRGTKPASSARVSTTAAVESFSRYSTSAALKIALIETVIAPSSCVA